MTHPSPSSRSMTADTLQATSARSAHRSTFATVRGLSGGLREIHSATRIADRYRWAWAWAHRLVTPVGVRGGSQQCAGWTSPAAVAASYR